MNLKNVLILLVVLIVIVVLAQQFRNKSADTSMVDETSSQQDAGEIGLFDAFQDQRSEISFAHVVPVEYSEVYFLVRGGTPGETKLVTLEGPGIISDKDQIATFDAQGEARYTWRINRYGTYSVYEDFYDDTTQQDVPMLMKSVEVN
ncbi:MAG: hypothetical protein R3B69_03000 [Candidatus Paceibacterota bacterium]